MTIDARLADALEQYTTGRSPSLDGHFGLDPFDRSGLGAVETADDDIVQVGLSAGVSAGAYDGDVRVADLAGKGDIGIGTLQGLDGEVVVVDGQFWSIDVDGRARPAASDALVPFAVLVHLTVADRLTITGPLDRESLEAAIRARLPDPDGCYAVRIDGRFGPVSFRSVRRQTPPYRPLAAVLATDQHQFAVDGLDATVVGFCFPDSSADLDFPGFHLHMLAADHSTGGHVFDLTVHHAEVSIGHCHTVHVELAGRRR